jgi:hypothetical protein
MSVSKQDFDKLVLRVKSLEHDRQQLFDMMSRVRTPEHKDTTVVIDADFDDPQPGQKGSAGCGPS